MEERRLEFIRLIIRYIIVMGDSLSDRGTFARRSILFGLIPKDWLVDMSKFPHGRFTNGYNWDDLICELLVSRFLVKDLEGKTHLEATEIADELETNDPRIKHWVAEEDTLDNDREVDSEGERFARTYCEGGLTAHDYSGWWTWSISLFTARKMVATLKQKLDLLLADDSKLAVTAKEKAESLIIECSGGNDLITVNKAPTKEEADRAVTARMENLKRLYANGYRNFAIMNLPNLACAPRFSTRSEEERASIESVCEYFNQQLAEQCQALQKDPAYKGLYIMLSDSFTHSTDIYNHPEKYGFDPAKRNLPYNDSPEFKRVGDTTPAKGFMYSDDIHPSAELHAVLAKLLLKDLEKHFDFRAPPPTLKTDARNMFRKFIVEYHKKLKASEEAMGGSYRESKLPKLAIHGDDGYQRALAAILDHGINGDGVRTREVLLEFGWIDNKNNIDVNNPALAAAKTIMDRGERLSPRV